MPLRGAKSDPWRAPPCGAVAQELSRLFSPPPPPPPPSGQAGGPPPTAGLQPGLLLAALLAPGPGGRGLFSAPRPWGAACYIFFQILIGASRTWNKTNDFLVSPGSGLHVCLFYLGEPRADRPGAGRCPPSPRKGRNRARRRRAGGRKVWEALAPCSVASVDGCPSIPAVPEAPPRGRRAGQGAGATRAEHGPASASEGRLCVCGWSEPARTPASAQPVRTSHRAGRCPYCPCPCAHTHLPLVLRV